jgi:parallel beta-helix repeat protein
MLSILGVRSAAAQITILVPADQPTIQAGINAASNGDTVLVPPGTYNENIDFKGKGITVTSGAKTYSDAATTIINSVTSGPPVVNFSTNEPATAVLNGFTIQGGHALSGPSAFSAGVLIVGSSPTVSNNIIQQNIGCGVFAYNGGNPFIQGNDIRQNRSPQTGEESLSIECGGPAGMGLVIEDAGIVTVTGNIIEENSTLSPFTDPENNVHSSAGIYILPTNKVILTNNIVRNNQGYAIDGLFYELGGSATGATLIMIQNLFYTDPSAPANSDSLVGIFGNESAPYPTLIEINNTFSSEEALEYTFAAGSTVEKQYFLSAEPREGRRGAKLQRVRHHQH